MNYIKAIISEIRSVDAINIVSFKAGDVSLKMVSLELNKALKVGAEVTLGAKSTNIALAKNLDGELSISNQLECTIISLEHGELLTRVKLAFQESELESVITKDSALRMKLHEGEELLALIKSSELSIVGLG